MRGCSICRRGKARARIAELIGRFGLAEHLDQRAAALPLGIRQRLSLAVAIVHEPEILILDEPTSGVDPLARDQFWELLIDLSRNQGVTIFVSTHFMNEAARCDRISLMDAGRVLATDTPAGLDRGARCRNARGCLHRLSRRGGGVRAAARQHPAAASRLEKRRHCRRRARRDAGSACGGCSPTRSARRWSCCATRSGSASRCFGTAFLMLVFGFGISTDVNHLSFAVLDRDQTPREPRLSGGVAGLDLFRRKAAARRLRAISSSGCRAARSQLAIEIPPGFGRDIARGRPVGRRLDRRRHAVPRRDDPRLSAGHAPALSRRPVVNDDAHRRRRRPRRSKSGSTTIRISTASTRWCRRTLAMLLALFPAILMALAIVREKELGSITNLYVTPVTPHRIPARQAAALCRRGHGQFRSDVAMALFVFQRAAEGQLSRRCCSAH